MNVSKFNSSTQFIAATEAVIVALCNATTGVKHIALSGGKTPRPIYEALATNAAIHFDDIEWYLVDERYVPLDHPDSNYKMIVEAFSAAQPTFSEHFHYFDTSLPLKESANRYETELKNIPGLQFDLCVLGIGSDGHTASLFPGSSALYERERLVVPAINEFVPHPPVHERLTLTWPMILKSKEVLLLASGQEKQAIIAELQFSHKQFTELPAKKLLEHHNFKIYFFS